MSYGLHCLTTVMVRRTGAIIDATSALPRPPEALSRNVTCGAATPESGDQQCRDSTRSATSIRVGGAFLVCEHYTTEMYCVNEN
jgi:hypothetical protein